MDEEVGEIRVIIVMNLINLLLIVSFIKDFAEHGIAPKSVHVKLDYKDEASSSSLSRKTVFRASAIENALEDLIQPAQNTIGVRMLRRMGWREGQGIGPRIKRRLRKLKVKLSQGFVILYLIHTVSICILLLRLFRDSRILRSALVSYKTMY